MFRTGLIGVLLIGLTATWAPAQDDAFARAVAAFRKGDFAAARTHAEAAIHEKPDREEARLLLGMTLLQLRENKSAVEALSAVVKANPKSVTAFDRRGDAYLKLGRFEEAVADFDRMLELKPDFAPEHWRRGIALYYVGRYADGVKQFETHRKANPQDVENAAWHYLCNVKVAGAEKARAGLIDVTDDRRVPMAEIQKLFAGKVKPEDVLAAAEKVKAGTEAGTEARFYAHLYVALWHESRGESANVAAHLAPAVEKHKIGHYMWDVANAHLQKLSKAK